MKILLNGSNGFLGKSFANVLKDKYDLSAVTRKDYDLVNQSQAEAMFRDIKPDVLVHLASKSGGILANKTYPANFWYENMIIAANMWELSRKYNVKKVVWIMPGCAYPNDAPVPIKEESMFGGFPDLHPAPGSMPKAMGILASYAYKKQYGLNSTILVPANCYGIEDVFDEMNSHVVPAMILKFHKAKIDKLEEITCWGSGEVLRDFVCVDDIAKLIPYFIENDINFKSQPHLENMCNLSTGKGTTIKELAETVAEIVGFNGKINWDISKPDGPKNKTFDNTRMKSLGLECPTILKDGLKKTYDWYIRR